MRLNKHSKGFTLVELLAVVAIIGILAAIILPTVTKFMTSAKKARAATEVRAIEAAIMAYYNEYGKLPIPDEVQGLGEVSSDWTKGAKNAYNTADNPDGPDKGIQDVVNILTAAKKVPLTTGTYAGIQKNTATAETMNPKNIVFLDAPKLIKDADGIVDETKRGLYLDPWDVPYIIKFDCDYNGKVAWFTGGEGEEYELLTKRAVVYSLGPPKRNKETGKLEPEVPADNTVLPDKNYPNVIASHFN